MEDLLSRGMFYPGDLNDQRIDKIKKLYASREKNVVDNDYNKFSLTVLYLTH